MTAILGFGLLICIVHVHKGYLILMGGDSEVWRINSSVKTYLPGLAFDSVVESSCNELHESNAFRNDTAVPSIITALGLLPHCSQWNPSEKSMSSSVMKEYHPILKWWYWKPAACRDCSAASQWIAFSIVYSVCIVVL